MLSELRKTRPDAQVLRWFDSLSPNRIFISALGLGELRKGAAMRARRDTVSAQALSDWIDELDAEFGSRVLSVNKEIAHIWGVLSADRSRPIVDTLLAATAIHHQLTLVTRNIRDVQDTPVIWHNPWLQR